MFQFLLFTGSIIAFIIGGLVVLIGIGVITGCAGGLLVMIAGGLVALLGMWSAVSFSPSGTRTFFQQGESDQPDKTRRYMDLKR